MILQINRKQLSKGTITDQYADVYIHVKDKKGEHSFVKANKVILAFHSHYFHKIFQSRDNIQVIDLAFVGTTAGVVRETVNMLYGQSINISEKDFNKFDYFLKFLEIEFDRSQCKEVSERSPKAKNLKRISTNTIINVPNEDDKNEADSQNSEDYSPRSKKSMSTTTSNLQQTSTMTATAPTAPITISASSTTFIQPAPATSFRSPTTLLAANRETSKRDASKKDESKKETSKKESSGTETSNTENVEQTSDPRQSWYTTRTGAPAFSDNWTETSESGLQDKLRDIDFRIGLTPSGHHNHYICCNCKKIVKAFSHAMTHYEESHQNSDKEIKVMREAIEYRTEAEKEIQKLQSQISDGCIQLLAVNQLR
jgi:hypothetical protein